MQHETIRIAIGARATSARDAQRINVPPVWTGGGLAVTRAHGAPGWAITHIASGYAVLRNVPRQRDAKAIAVRLQDGIDWTRSRTDITRDLRVRDRARQIRDEARMLGMLP